MVDREAVRQAFRGVLLGLAGFPRSASNTNIPLAAWENRQFTPPADGLWLREVLVPIREGLVASNKIMLHGYMRYDALCPVGSGTEAANALVKAMGDALKPATSLTPTNGAQVSIVQTDPKQGMPDQVYERTWYSVPLLVRFFAYEANN